MSKQCWRWRHKWVHESGRQLFTTSYEIRRCMKCNKHERLDFWFGELMEKHEIVSEESEMFAADALASVRGDA